MHVLRPVVVVVAVVMAGIVRQSTSSGPCRNDTDCHLAGRCVGGGCICAGEWTGTRCQSLALAPAEVTSGFRQANRSSWGGGIVKLEGRYHMYAASFVDGCGLTTWKTNSEIVHAVSDAPTGPYAVSDVVLKAFAHNPTVVQVDDTLVMAHIGCGNGTVTPRRCFNGSTCNETGCVVPSTQGLASSNPQEADPTSSNPHAGAAGTGRGVGGQQKSCDTPHWTGIRTTSAETPGGPWTSASSTGFTITSPDPSRPSWHEPSVTNPSIWVLHNGSVLLAYSAGCAACPVSTGHKHIGVAHGLSWRGPFIDLTPSNPIFPFASEDPCLFVSPELGSYHLLAHTDYTGVAEQPANWSHVSAHAFTGNPFTPGGWVVSKTPPYTRTRITQYIPLPPFF